MFVSIGLAIAGIFGKTPGTGIAKILGIGAAVFLGIAILGIGKCAYDSRVIGTYQAKQDAANAKADLRANENAAEARRDDDARQQNEATELGKVTSNASLSDLDRRRARQRCIGLQQSARSTGREPPSCD